VTMWIRRTPPVHLENQQELVEGVQAFGIAVEGLLAAVNGEIAGQVGRQKAQEGESGQSHQEFLATEEARVVVNQFMESSATKE